MPDPAADFDAYIPGALASMGIEADETEIAIMRFAHGLYWPAIRAFLEADLSAIEPEPDFDPTRAPSR